MTPEQTLSPLEQYAHEARLEAALDEYLASRGQPELERVKLWAKFVNLHIQRSPERVAEMEQQQGLR